VQQATISHLLLDNVMRSDPLFSSERSVYDEFLAFCFRIDDFSARTRLMNADAVFLETLNRLFVSGSVSKRSDQIRNPSALTTGCYFRARFLQRRSEHQACGRQKVMEWGFDGVLLNSDISRVLDPVTGAFAKAVRAGRSAFLGGPKTVQEMLLVWPRNWTRRTNSQEKPTVVTRAIPSMLTQWLDSKTSMGRFEW
jgi:hypothetical protein